jgi:hypothetical protein
VADHAGIGKMQVTMEKWVLTVEHAETAIKKKAEH